MKVKGAGELCLQCQNAGILSSRNGHHTGHATYICYAFRGVGQVYMHSMCNYYIPNAFLSSSVLHTLIFVSALHEMGFIVTFHFKGEETEAHRGKETL